jgi:pimeloyl-ACP methyl ester carboxylesterase
VPGVSIPPFLTLPDGVKHQIVETDQGVFATLDNELATSATVGTALLVPGFTGSKEDFISLLEPLARRRIRAVAIDLAGQYESPVTEGADLSVAGLASGVWAIAASLRRPLALVGHSFGGLVVREAILSNPLAADALVLIASGPAAVPAPQQQVLHQFAQVMSGYGLEAVWQGKQAMDAASGVSAPPPDIDTFLARRFLSNDRRALAAMIVELCEAHDRTDALATVTPEVVTIIGELDDVWPLREQRDMAGRLGARVVQLSSAGHSPVIDEPEAVADAIASLQCFG